MNAIASEPAPPPTPVATRRARRWWAPALLGVVAVSAGVTLAATTHNSATFDEIVFMAAGARGLSNGEFDLIPDHPPLPQYLYGLPLHLAGAHLPDEAVLRLPVPRYSYARFLFWASNNDADRLLFLGRCMAVALAASLVLLVFAFTHRYWGPWAGVTAATLVAFLPDVLAHGGIGYTDVPVAAAYLAGAWAVDAAARRPTVRRGAIAGFAIAIAVSIKYSAALLGPVALALIALEAWGRHDRGRWLKATGVAAGAALLAGYLTLVAVYRGDVLLAGLWRGLDETFLHVTGGHGAPAYLFGRLSVDGWWYFYPVAFFLKTPVPLHLLLVLGVAALVVEARGRAPLELAGSPLRVPLVAGALYGAVLVASSLDIGFRYAMPLLPPLCILVAVGVARLGRRRPRTRRALAGLVVVHVALALSWYPHFLAYTSEYMPSRDDGHRALVDSSLDWGQSLIELRDFMRDERIDRIYLSYFGSAVPNGYGIDFVALPSFFELRPQPRTGADPRFIAISATNLHGVYLNGDPFARFRDIEPYRVLGHSMFVYKVPGDAPAGEP